MPSVGGVRFWGRGDGWWIGGEEREGPGGGGNGAEEEDCWFWEGRS